MSGRFAIWNLGFRPFFLLAGVWGLLAMLAWIAPLSGWWAARPLFAGPPWHAHEMIFGYAFAVIVGFLLTAVRNWTNQATPQGWPLAAIVALWLLARAAVTLHWTLPALGCDLAFALTAAWGIGVPLVKSRNQRNYFFVGLILLLGLLNLGFYLAALGLVDWAPSQVLLAALDGLVIYMIVLGGRVIPMFSANAVPGLTTRRYPWLERLAIGSVAALFLLDALGGSGMAVGGVAALAALLHGLRLVLWQPWKTVSRPILWILHLSYAWIVVFFALRAAVAMGGLPMSFAIHALTVGGVGGLTLGMMTRVSRGHTGLPLVAGAAEVAAYGLIQLAAVIRVFVPWCWPAWYAAAVTCSGLLWGLAFALFVIRFAPVLARPRADGRSG